MLELKEVSFTILKDGEEIPLVDRVSICVPKGHFMAIVGPSGCGKTTLLKEIAETPSRVNAEVAGIRRALTIFAGMDRKEARDLLQALAKGVPAHPITMQARDALRKRSSLTL